MHMYTNDCVTPQCFGMLIMLWCSYEDHMSCIVISFTLALSSGLLASVSDDATVWIQSLNNRKKV